MITAERLRSVLRYEPNTGDFYWIAKTANATVLGSRAGTFMMRGCIGIKIDGRTYKAHRLAWLYVYGCWPTDQIDHKNRSPSDNRFDNLREADSNENNQNRSRPVGRMSPLKGASWNTGKRKWIAQIQHRNQYVYLGKYDCPIAAHLQYCIATAKFHGQFARTT